MGIKCNFIVKRETKGAIVYQQVDKNGRDWEVNDGAAVGQVYIRKSAFNGRVPPQVCFEITEGKTE